ncbi:MAG: Flp family type IVb pilin [Boseongicola sp.]|nr:MAG: Flp family type IVb pilin [Boseongicola sp.]
MCVNILGPIVQKFAKSENGATLIEYGVALIIAIAVGGGGLSVLAASTGVNMASAEQALIIQE